ncbi:hypothetical protein CPLU01_00154 [Colletotrichum plurivorum]|uniref:Uncharacterized protein n=1 Tax=Colletotrichum plurivorum TaxID=2175906 RepID=A0A8H6U6M1_9PEZI|nr:hypothetical protein CPLU01_00154 [Colletotrichum plurivorum]
MKVESLRANLALQALRAWKPPTNLFVRERHSAGRLELSVAREVPGHLVNQTKDVETRTWRAWLSGERERDSPEKGGVRIKHDHVSSVVLPYEWRSVPPSPWIGAPYLFNRASSCAVRKWPPDASSIRRGEQSRDREPHVHVPLRAAGLDIAALQQQRHHQAADSQRRTLLDPERAADAMLALRPSESCPLVYEQLADEDRRRGGRCRLSSLVGDLALTPDSLIAPWALYPVREVRGRGPSAKPRFVVPRLWFFNTGIPSLMTPSLPIAPLLHLGSKQQGETPHNGPAGSSMRICMDESSRPQKNARNALRTSQRAGREFPEGLSAGHIPEQLRANPIPRPGLAVHLPIPSALADCSCNFAAIASLLPQCLSTDGDRLEWVAGAPRMPGRLAKE